MSQQSKIEWTDASWNPVRGCTKISPGCAHCYAETFAERFRGVPGHPYEQGFDLRLAPDKLDAPLHWKKPKMIFVNSMSDLFHEDVPDEYIDQVFGVMGACEEEGLGHTFQLLTKRAERMRDYMQMRGHKAWNARRLGTEAYPPRNVWAGVSVENQKYADERVHLLLQTPAAVRFLSMEPLLSAVKLRHDWLWEFDAAASSELAAEVGRSPIDWIIVGGESGSGARPCRIDYIEQIKRQCVRARVPVFVKQLGSAPTVPYYESDGHELRDWALDFRDEILWPGGEVHSEHDGQPPPHSMIRVKAQGQKRRRSCRVA